MPIAARILFAVALITVIGLLATAALGRHYRLVCRAAAAACVGTVLLNTAMIGTILVTAPALARPAAVAVIVSAGRSGFALRNVRHALAG